MYVSGNLFIHLIKVARVVERDSFDTSKKKTMTFSSENPACILKYRVYHQHLRGFYKKTIFAFMWNSLGITENS